LGRPRAESVGGLLALTNPSSIRKGNTIKCPNAAVGDTGVVSGVAYSDEARHHRVGRDRSVHKLFNQGLCDVPFRDGSPLV